MAATGAPGHEQDAAACRLERDIFTLVGTFTPASPALAALAERASLQLALALQEAAGRPDDARWFRAYKALDEFVAGYRLGTRHGDAAYRRLCGFLAENRDLEFSPSAARRSAR